MVMVVTKPCSGCKYTDCVVVCLVEAFHEGETMLYISEACVECDACVPECPVEAIYLDRNVPAKWEHYIELNRVMCQQLPQITEKKEPLCG